MPPMKKKKSKKSYNYLHFLSHTFNYIKFKLNLITYLRIFVKHAVEIPTAGLSSVQDRMSKTFKLTG